MRRLQLLTFVVPLLAALACNDALTAPKPKLTFNTASATLASGGPFAYVTNSGSGTVSVIATATNAVVATVPVGAAPFGVAITPNGAFAYVTFNNINSNTVPVIATATNTVVATVAVGLDWASASRISCSRSSASG
jgi:YVTN family beta-propeller protein